MLSRQAPLQAWLEWAEGCADQCLSSSPSSTSGLEEAGRALCLRWSFFTSLLLRDLTLKGGHSFGSFHLLRLLLDEYVMFYVERRIDHFHRLREPAASAVAAGVSVCVGVDEGDVHPGIRQDVLMSPKHMSAWQRATSQDSLL